jgi:quercetin dioxygenase-like cupin family protein
VWNRPYIPKRVAAELPWEAAATVAPTLAAGSEVRVLSRDTDANASTCLWRVPPIWSHEGAFRLSGDEQLFVLEGQLNLGRHELNAGSYACHPAGSEHGPLFSEKGALVLAMWDGWKVLDDESRSLTGEQDISVIDTTSVEGEPTPIEGPVEGILVKILRNVETTGGMTLLVTIPGGWEDPRSEHHDCVEESYKLDGDIWLVENGQEQGLAAGDYFYRPGRIKHGPFRTDNGTTSLIRFSAKLVNHYGPL